MRLTTRQVARRHHRTKNTIRFYHLDRGVRRQRKGDAPSSRRTRPCGGDRWRALTELAATPAPAWLDGDSAGGEQEVVEPIYGSTQHAACSASASPCRPSNDTTGQATFAFTRADDNGEIPLERHRRRRMWRPWRTDDRRIADGQYRHAVDASPSRKRGHAQATVEDRGLDAIRPRCSETRAGSSRGLHRHLHRGCAWARSADGRHARLLRTARPRQRRT